MKNYYLSFIFFILSFSLFGQINENDFSLNLKFYPVSLISIDKPFIEVGTELSFKKAVSFEFGVGVRYRDTPGSKSSKFTPLGLTEFKGSKWRGEIRYNIDWNNTDRKNKRFISLSYLDLDDRKNKHNSYFIYLSSVDTTIVSTEDVGEIYCPSVIKKNSLTLKYGYYFNWWIFKCEAFFGFGFTYKDFIYLKQANEYRVQNIECSRFHGTSYQPRILYGLAIRYGISFKNLNKFTKISSVY